MTSRRQFLALPLLPSVVPSLGAAVASMGPTAAQATPPLPTALNGRAVRLVHNWDFGHGITTQAALREHFHTRYIYEDGQLDRLNDEWQRYRDDDNHRFEDGALSLVAHAHALAPGRITSGMLRSKWSGQYGYFECRMQVPAARGLWPAFWLNPEDGIWPPEIDVVEVVNNGRDGPHNSFHFLHGREARHAPKRYSRLDRWHAYRPGIDYSNGFHRFAVDWQPGRVRHYVDDELVIERDFEWRHNDGRDAGPAHVLVNLAVGGRWPGAPQSLHDFPARLRIAHIRVWQAA